MASEIIVQTLKGPSSGANANKVIIPSGQTLDASEGFVPPAGSVINAHRVLCKSSVDLNTTSWTNIPSGSFSYTPKKPDSLLHIQVFAHVYNNDTSTWESAAVRCTVDGVTVSDTPENSNYYGFAGYAGRNMGYAIDTAEYTCVSSSAITITAQVLCRQGTGSAINRYGFGHVLVTEIAQ